MILAFGWPMMLLMMMMTGVIVFAETKEMFWKFGTLGNLNRDFVFGAARVVLVG